MPESTTLTVVRRPAHPNRLRAYRVLLDDKDIGSVKNGQSFSTSVTSGEHTLAVKVDWVRSRHLQLSCADGATTFVRCETSGDPLEILKGVLGRPSAHLTLSLQADGAVEPTHDEVAARQGLLATRIKRAATWLAACIAIGVVLALLVASGSAPPEVVARRHMFIGQLTGFVGTAGAMWRFLRNPKFD